MMNALLTCVVSNNNVKMAQDGIEDHARLQMLGGNSDGWIHSNQPFAYRLRRAHLELFALSFSLCVSYVVRKA